MAAFLGIGQACAIIWTGTEPSVDTLVRTGVLASVVLELLQSLFLCVGLGYKLMTHNSFTTAVNFFVQTTSMNVQDRQW